MRRLAGVPGLILAALVGWLQRFDDDRPDLGGED